MEANKPLRLLALDGGGIRGLSSLYIIKSLMSHLDSKVDKSVKRPLLPCNYFDLIAGTFTGGLIAVMLGILCMDIDTCINEYLKTGPEIFPIEGLISKNKLSKAWKFISDQSRFNPEPLEKAIQMLVENT